MTCGAGGDCVEPDLALAFAENRLDASARDEVERRIDACGQCRSVVAEAARVSARTVADRSAPPKPRPRAAAALAPGTAVGRYVIERSLGAGGMGVAMLARDPQLRRPVVIKLVHPDWRAGERAAAFEARLVREAQAMAQVSHRNVVQIFDTGRHGDTVFLAMELVDGPTLDDWLFTAKPSPPEILAALRGAGRGLAAAHRTGLIHRDIKPTNILIARDGTAKVMDFGLARAVDSPDSPMPGAPERSGVYAVLTRANSIVGTPEFMAPEQREGGTVDGRSDQFAFALTLLDSLLDQPPRERRASADDPPELIARELRAKGVDARIAAAITRALRAKPADRFATMDAFVDALEPPNRRWLFAAVGAAILAGVASFALVRGTRGACVPTVSSHWGPGARDAVLAAAARSDAPFASWSAAHAIAALDVRAAALSTAQCGDGSGGCVEHQLAAIDRAVAEGVPSVPALRAIDRCADPPPSPLRAKLNAIAPGPTAALDARAIGDDAVAAGEDDVAADAYERAGNETINMLDRDDAATRFLAMAAVGEHAGDDAIRGRALLGLIDTARWNGHHADAVRSDQELAALIGRHPLAPADALRVELFRAITFTELGDVDRAFAAWDRAAAAARTPDEKQRVAVGHAGATWALRRSLPAARAELARAGTSVEANRLAAELAIEARDAAAAETAASAVVHARPDDPLAQLLLARARALKDPAGALAMALAVKMPSDPTDRERAQVAVAEVRVASDPAEGVREFTEVLQKAIGYSADRAHVLRLTADERFAQAYALCHAQSPCTLDYMTDHTQLLPPDAPRNALVMIANARQPFFPPESRGMFLKGASDMLERTHADPMVVATLQLEALQTGYRAIGMPEAQRARAAFVAAGATEQLAAIDAWIAAKTP